MHFDKRHVLFLLFTAIAFWMAYPPLSDLLRSSDEKELYSHIILIPVVTAYLIYAKRQALFSDPHPSHGPGIALLAIGVLLFLIGSSQQPALSPNDYASIRTLSAVVSWTGAFILLYGLKALRSATFPFLFLLFAIPVPAAVMNRIILVLQVGSAMLTYLLFSLTGMPFSQEGLIFHLPKISIVVAEQCSGIRSSLALLITTLLAAYFLLETNWRRAMLALCVIPVAIFKNAVRIVTISWLADRVDRAFLTAGFIHRSGGFIFFGVGLVILGAILLLLRRSEQESAQIPP